MTREPDENHCGRCHNSGRAYGGASRWCNRLDLSARDPTCRCNAEGGTIKKQIERQQSRDERHAHGLFPERPLRSSRTDGKDENRCVKTDTLGQSEGVFCLQGNVL